MPQNTSTYHQQFRKHLERVVVVDDEAFEEIIQSFSIKEINKKDYLLRPFQVCRYESYIIKGLFQTTMIDDEGRQHTLHFPHEDWWVGDFKSFRKEQESNMEIFAVEDALLLQISKSAMYQLFDISPAFERFFRIMAENAAMALQDRLLKNYSHNAESKLFEFQKKYPSLKNRLSQKQIASYLGVTPEYFSQMVKKK
ncbi:Crp/Fnr family transcriptional regulator [Chondrinema litorale]|uniref:Crp/Fnr family transcriptional regulator n=1 Tax=Chondrinema litorale TaxID=2994555 RepID=UPI002542C29D|nr:Crp/Fnr family transcriptional regulator [Chondrinema litorale]UZR94586.1 Crp/Fnr family transcriptional regulator [Chondrinema litorale]